MLRGWAPLAGRFLSLSLSCRVRGTVVPVLFRKLLTLGWIENRVRGTTLEQRSFHE